MANTENPFRPPAREHSPAGEFLHFETAFLPSWCLLSLSAFINVPLVVSGAPGLAPLSTGLATFILSVVFAAFTNWLIIKRFTVQVSPSRLRCCNFWGIYSVSEWEKIETVKATRIFFGLSYLRLFTSDLPRPIWLPLFLSHKDEFYDCVQKYAGQQSVLVNAMNKAGLSDTVKDKTDGTATRTSA